MDALEEMNKQLIEQNKELLDELHREKPRRGRPPMNRDDDINIKVA